MGMRLDFFRLNQPTTAKLSIFRSSEIEQDQSPYWVKTNARLSDPIIEPYPPNSSASLDQRVF
jgi:hypothetical protein